MYTINNYLLKKIHASNYILKSVFFSHVLVSIDDKLQMYSLS